MATSLWLEGTCKEPASARRDALRTTFENAEVVSVYDKRGGKRHGTPATATLDMARAFCVLFVNRRPTRLILRAPGERRHYSTAKPRKLESQ